MAISKGSSTGHEACCFTLAVEQYDAQQMECVVYMGVREHGYCCHSFFELAWQMERGFEKMDYPTPSVQKRTFAASGIAKSGKIELEDRLVPGRMDGSRGNFLIRVRQCYHATWQGQISRKGEEQDGVLFESFLEFIMILDGLLSGGRSAGRTKGASLVKDLAAGLILAGRYDGIWVEAQASDEVLVCGRNRKDGGKETFAVRPMFEENHTLQGSVSWMEGRQQKNFRSFLELLFLMMSAARRQAAKEA